MTEPSKGSEASNMSESSAANAQGQVAIQTEGQVEGQAAIQAEGQVAHTESATSDAAEASLAQLLAQLKDAQPYDMYKAIMRIAYELERNPLGSDVFHANKGAQKIMKVLRLAPDDYAVYSASLGVYMYQEVDLCDYQFQQVESLAKHVFEGLTSRQQQVAALEFLRVFRCCSRWVTSLAADLMMYFVKHSCECANEVAKASGVSALLRSDYAKANVSGCLACVAKLCLDATSPEPCLQFLACDGVNLIKQQFDKPFEEDTCLLFSEGVSALVKCGLTPDERKDLHVMAGEALWRCISSHVHKHKHQLLQENQGLDADLAEGLLGTISSLTSSMQDSNKGLYHQAAWQILRTSECWLPAVLQKALAMLLACADEQFISSVQKDDFCLLHKLVTSHARARAGVRVSALHLMTSLEHSKVRNFGLWLDLDEDHLAFSVAVAAVGFVGEEPQHVEVMEDVCMVLKARAYKFCTKEEAMDEGVSVLVNLLEIVTDYMQRHGHYGECGCDHHNKLEFVFKALIRHLDESCEESKACFCEAFLKCDGESVVLEAQQCEERWSECLTEAHTFLAKHKDTFDMYRRQKELEKLVEEKDQGLLLAATTVDSLTLQLEEAKSKQALAEKAHADTAGTFTLVTLELQAAKTEVVLANEAHAASVDSLKLQLEEAKSRLEANEFELKRVQKVAEKAHADTACTLTLVTLELQGAKTELVLANEAHAVSVDSLKLQLEEAKSTLEATEFELKRVQKVAAQAETKAGELAVVLQAKTTELARIHVVLKEVTASASSFGH